MNTYAFLTKYLDLSWICLVWYVFRESSHFLIKCSLLYMSPLPFLAYLTIDSCDFISSQKTFWILLFRRTLMWQDERLGDTWATLLSSILSLDRKITHKFPRGCNPIPVNCLENNLFVLKESLLLVNFLMKNSGKTLT